MAVFFKRPANQISSNEWSYSKNSSCWTDRVRERERVERQELFLTGAKHLGRGENAESGPQPAKAGERKLIRRLVDS